MKKTLSWVVKATILFCISSSVNAQIKVFPNNKVLMGSDQWGATYSRTEELFINGNIGFNHQPAVSDINIANYPYHDNGQTYNLLSIIPQWGNTSLVGLPTAQMFQVHSQEIYSTG